MTWTTDRVNLLRVLWAQGSSSGQIAKRLGGVTRSAVIGKIFRLGLPKRALPNRSYGNQRPKRAKLIVQAARPLLPKPKPAPIAKPRTPENGINAVRFIDRAASQCPMFCTGEEGPDGFVCGEAVAPGSVWCASCQRLVFTPQQTREAA